MTICIMSWQKYLVILYIYVHNMYTPNLFSLSTTFLLYISLYVSPLFRNTYTTLKPDAECKIIVCKGVVRNYSYYKHTYTYYYDYFFFIMSSRVAMNLAQCSIYLHACMCVCVQQTGQGCFLERETQFLHM